MLSSPLRTTPRTGVNDRWTIAMLNNPESLVCWHCGIHLKDILIPVVRTAQCPQCRVDLYVCRMCKHFDRRYTSHCAHQTADKVLEKTRVNHCSHFRVRHRAYDASDDHAVQLQRKALETLFGSADSAAGEPTEAANRKEFSEARKTASLQALDELFGNNNKQ